MTSHRTPRFSLRLFCPISPCVPLAIPLFLILNQEQLIKRITFNPEIFGGKPIIRGRRLAVEHVLDMLAAGDDPTTILQGYPWLEADDIQACLVYASRLARNERIELFPAALAS